jgi:uncharacterized integral membrane protein
MSITQLITLLIFVGGLAIFTIQNLSPSLSLNFLGNQLPTLPLSVWILIAIVGGILTYGIITQLFQVASRNLGREDPAPTAFQNPSRRSSKPSIDPDPSSSWGEPSPPPKSAQTSGYSVYNSVNNSDPEPTRSRSSDDDWETEVKPFNPSWEAEDSAEERRPNAQTASNSSYNSSEQEQWDNQENQPFTSAPKVYETEKQPQSESWSGSVYSYGYRDSSSTGVGKVETIYDADYRIITPPPQTKIQDDIQPPNYPANDDDEDWGLDEDDRLTG